MKTQLNRELALIRNDIIRTLTRAVLDAAPTCFWLMPASTTGKYHPEHSLGEGGLIRHTKAVVHLTLHLLDMEGIDPATDTHDIAIAAAILHDCCKKNDMEKYTAFDHPLRAAGLIESTYDSMQLGFDAETAKKYYPHARTLMALVAAHMGRWNTNPRSGKTLPRPATPLQRLLHTADYLASRKELLPEGI